MRFPGGVNTRQPNCKKNFFCNDIIDNENLDPAPLTASGWRGGVEPGLDTSFPGRVRLVGPRQSGVPDRDIPTNIQHAKAKTRHVCNFELHT